MEVDEGSDQKSDRMAGHARLKNELMEDEQYHNLMLRLNFEPQHNKTNKMVFAPSEDSDQPGFPPSLIRVFAVRMEKALVLSYPLSAQQ